MGTKFLAGALVLAAMTTCGAEERLRASDCKQPGVPCSETWQFTGACSGADMWNQWTISGRHASSDYFVRPFTDHPIRIVGYELMKIQIDPKRDVTGFADWLKSLFRPKDNIEYLNTHISYFMIGSTIQQDAMLWLYPGQTGGRRDFPAGLSQPWPSAKDAKPVTYLYDKDGKIYGARGDLLDIHGICFGGGPVTILMTLYYVSATEETSDRGKLVGATGIEPVTPTMSR